MSQYKITGHCTLCDGPCFDVLAVNSEHERFPGEPKRLGKPTDDAVRVSFMLMDGSKTSLTFCGPCAETLPSVGYLEIWRKNMRSWMRELDQKPEEERNPDWFVKQFGNGILCEMGRQKWTEIING